MAATAARVGPAATRTGLPFGASTSPVRVAVSLATTPMSPAGTAGTSTCSLPRNVNSPCRRSSVLLRVFVRWMSGVIVPERTRKSERWPT